MPFRERQINAIRFQNITSLVMSFRGKGKAYRLSNSRLSLFLMVISICALLIQLFSVSKLTAQEKKSNHLIPLSHQQLDLRRLDHRPDDIIFEDAGEPALVNRTRSSAGRLPPQPQHRLRILFGILTADFRNDVAYRKRHRRLFTIWNDDRTCTLDQFRKDAAVRHRCELIYTFVMGGALDADAPTQLVSEENGRPIELTKPVSKSGRISPDINEPDMTLLNIRENMEDGKSQTWFNYAAQVARSLDIDYIAKCDADALLHLHEFFVWAYTNLPPAPYNRGMYAGALRDKAYWPKRDDPDDLDRFEGYWGKYFQGVHIYIAGQLYILSTDLAEFVGEEARRMGGNCTYCEHIEDHDISAMAFHSENPVKWTAVGRNMRFWEHPVKGEPRWRRILAREEARMKGEPFEGKIFFKNSRYEDVIGR